MTVANNYNLNFKEEMDESLYKLVVGYVTLDNIESDKSLKNPYVLIEELRSEFTRLTAITTESESKLWLESLLRNINALEKEWMILWTASMPEAGTVRISRCWITISIFLQS